MDLVVKRSVGGVKHSDGGTISFSIWRKKSLGIFGFDKTIIVLLKTNLDGIECLA
jgi:hypothetical protein